MPPAEQRLWTILIRGPHPFSFHSPGNPPVEHLGGTPTVVHLVLRQEEVGAIKLQAAGAGCSVSGFPMEGQTEEQSAERSRFMEAGEGEPYWPTPACPTCPWFDPLESGSPCGQDTLPTESVSELLRTSERHVQAKVACQR